MDDIKEYLKQTNTVLVTREAFYELVKRAAAQPEIIRCRDCRHFHEEPDDPFWDRCDSTAWYDGDGNEQQVRPTDYCSFAERR